MVQHISRIIAQVADWIVAIVRIIKGDLGQAWKSIEVQNFLKVTDSVGREIQIIKRHQTVKTCADRLDPISTEI